jgi:hypothetical protein
VRSPQTGRLRAAWPARRRDNAVNSRNAVKRSAVSEHFSTALR